MKKVAFEKRAVDFAQTEPIYLVESVMRSMKAVLDSRSPKPVKERKKAGTIPGVPGTVRPAQGGRMSTPAVEDRSESALRFFTDDELGEMYREIQDEHRRSECAAGCPVCLEEMMIGAQEREVDLI